jgi:2-polyprenyl-3-methyl-5-hydroxy-6-metoxy-1,4-benzoquinol methylase
MQNEKNMRIKCKICESPENTIFMVKDKYIILKCKNCNFVYLKNLITKKELDCIYDKFDYKNPIISEKRIRGDAKRSLKIIEKFITKSDMDLLDIGCGRGYFMGEARERGWTVSGIDISSKVTSFAQTKLKLNNIIHGDILKTNFKKKYSVIILNQVIEHMENSIKVIQKCYDLLKENGLIYIATPNIGSFSFKVNRENFDYIIPPEHIGYYDVNSLRYLLEKDRLKPIYFGTWSYPEDFAGIIKRLFKKNKINNINNSISNNVNNIQNEVPVNKNKILKILLFDKLFCNIFYRLLNINNYGTNIEVIGIKK